MDRPEYFISCDWGTSNFRLRKVDTKTLDVLDDHQTNVGIKKCYENFKNQRRTHREEFFAHYLLGEVKNCSWDGAGKTTIIASGMASSSIGMIEMEYATMPISFNGNGLISREIPLDASTNLLLISGARTERDVMRGEETQATGLADYLPKDTKGVLILPGTHSKHLAFEAEYFVDIHTFMTGEMFDLLTNESTLQTNVMPTDWSHSYEKSFLHGVEEGLEKNLLSSLFAVRSKNLIHKNSTRENYYYLSGLLIGSEISTLKNHDTSIFLAASGITHELYKLALKSFLPPGQLESFAPSLVDKSALIGQRKILRTYE